MTAIAAIVENGVVYIGGDSAGVNGLSLQSRLDPKVFINGECIFGYTSSFRMGQILQYSFTSPIPLEAENGMDYMVKRFIPAVKIAMRECGFQTTKNGQDFGGTFIVGYRGELYSIEDDYQVARLKQAYHACGCGSDLILGSLYTTDEYEMSPSERIATALRAAEAFSAGVRGPFTVLSK